MKKMSYREFCLTWRNKTMYYYEIVQSLLWKCFGWNGSNSFFCDRGIIDYKCENENSDYFVLSYDDTKKECYVYLYLMTYDKDKLEKGIDNSKKEFAKHGVEIDFEHVDCKSEKGMYKIIFKNIVPSEEDIGHMGPGMCWADDSGLSLEQKYVVNMK